MNIVPDYDHTRARKRSYPDMDDQLDAIFKMAKHLQEQGIDIGEDARNWINHIEGVKHAFPKKQIE